MDYVDAIPLTALFVGAVAAFWGSIEIGYRIGRWRHGYRADEKDQPVGAMVASILALLALVLGFTFSLAAQRFESRRLAALDEANAIGTLYLRSKLLEEPERSDVARRLQAYVEQRLAGAGSSGNVELQAAIARSEELHRELWRSAESAAAKRDSPVTSLFVDSLNELIDMHSRRLHVSVRGRNPDRHLDRPRRPVGPCLRRRRLPVRAFGDQALAGDARIRSGVRGRALPDRGPGCVPGNGSGWIR